MNYQLSFLTWLIIPLILVFVAVSYLINSFTQPRWHSQFVLADNRTSQLQQDVPQPNSVTPLSWNGEGLVTFWFDDAWVSQYDYAFPILEKYGYKGSVAVPTEYMEFDYYMNWNQLKRLQYLGWEINAHSRVHRCDVEHMTEKEITSEVVGSGQDLAGKGLRHDIYVLPCGVHSNLALDLAQQNYQALRTVQPGLNSLPITNRYDLKIFEVNKRTKIEEVQEWIKKAIEEKSWLILTFHQVSEEEYKQSEYAITPETFEQVVKEVKNSSLDVVLPSQVLNI